MHGGVSYVLLADEEEYMFQKGILTLLCTMNQTLLLTEYW